MQMRYYRSYTRLNQIAMDLVNGKIFTTLDIQQPDLSHMVFMPLVFLNRRQIRQLKRQIKTGSAALGYEYFDKAMPRTVNGMPIFATIQHLNKEETYYVLEKARDIHRLQEAMINA